MSSKTASKIMLWMIVIVTIFHASILLKIIPYEITWGGRLKNDNEMYVFETISIAINLFLGFIILIKAEFIKQLLPPKAVNVILWIFVILFALNTLGNIVAKTYFEKSLAVLTLASAILIGVIILKSKQHRKNN